MEPKEAKEIYILTKRPHDLLNDTKAVNAIRKFQKSRELGDSKLNNYIDIYEKCKNLLGEKQERLTEDELKGLILLGIGENERKQLRSSLSSSRPTSKKIIMEIQESTVNKMVSLDEFNKFKNWLLDQSKAK